MEPTQTAPSPSSSSISSAPPTTPSPSITPTSTANFTQTATTQPPVPTATTSIDDEEREDIEEFLASMDDFIPAIPDEVTNYYLGKTGFLCSDIRVKRVVALAAQKFISDIATDALQYCKIRQQGPAYRDKRSAKSRRLVLTMEDLTPALREYGISVKKPDYYVDEPTQSPPPPVAGGTAGSAGTNPSSSSSSSSASASASKEKRKRTSSK